MTLDQAILLHRQAVEEHKQACVNQGLLIEEVAETNILFWKKLHKQNVPTIDEMSEVVMLELRMSTMARWVEQTKNKVQQTADQVRRLFLPRS
tara:strand:- start:375 stop:653 length:279 start_codon:yes stop_codon:yes gene_type:complete